MNYVFTVFLTELLVDLPVIITAFICMYFVFSVYLPRRNTRKQKWISLIIVELFEHFIVPLILIATLLETNSWISAALFHLVLLSFLFLFIGFVVVKAKTWGDWFRITAIAAFAYFFIFVYPFILIYIQLHSSITGWVIMIVTVLFFFGMYLLRNKENNRNI